MLCALMATESRLQSQPYLAPELMIIVVVMVLAGRECFVARQEANQASDPLLDGARPDRGSSKSRVQQSV